MSGCGLLDASFVCADYGPKKGAFQDFDNRYPHEEHAQGRTRLSIVRFSIGVTTEAKRHRADGRFRTSVSPCLCGLPAGEHSSAPPQTTILPINFAVLGVLRGFQLDGSGKGGAW